MPDEQRKMTVSDSSPLIGMVAIGRLELLKDLYSEVFLPDAVYGEVVVEGKRLRKSGAEEVQRAVNSGWIKLTVLTAAEVSMANGYEGGGLGRGEAQAIAVARSRGLRVILDDRHARQLAESLGLEFVGTAGVLLERFLRGFLTKGQLAGSLRDLGKVIWLSPEVVAELLRLAEEER